MDTLGSQRADAGAPGSARSPDGSPHGPGGRHAPPSDAEPLRAWPKICGGAASAGPRSTTPSPTWRAWPHARDDTRTLDAALTVLSERGASGLASLRTETAAMRRPTGPPPAFRLADGKPAPYRPRDLDWRVLASVLDAGAPR